MKILRRDARRTKGFTDLLEYYGIVEDGVISLDNGSLLAAFEFRGPDLDFLDPHENAALARSLAPLFSLGAGWTVQTDLIRQENHDYPATPAWMPAISRLIDEERASQAALTGHLSPFLSRYFISFTYRPLNTPKQKLADWLFEQGAGTILEKFISVLSDVEVTMAAHLKRYPGTFLKRLRTRKQNGAFFCDLCSYVRCCISGDHFSFRLPPEPVWLAQFMGQDLTTGSVPRFGRKHIAVLAIDSFPDYTFAGITVGLENLRIPFRYSQHALSLSAEEATLAHDTRAKHYNTAKLGPVKRFLGRPETPGSIDTHAEAMEADARRASLEAEHGAQKFVTYGATVILMDEDPARLADHVRLAREAIRGLPLVGNSGFNCREEDDNAMTAWHSSFPGHSHIQRRTLDLSSVNTVHMLPLSAPWTGDQFNPSAFMPPNTPPIFVAYAAGGTPFRVHVQNDPSGVGHTLVAGPSGHGKTTWLALTAALWPRVHPNAQLFCIDKDYQLQPLFYAMRGDYYDLAPGSGLKLCPLSDLESDDAMAQAVRYIEDLIGLNNLKATAEMRNAISKAMRLHAESDHRSLSDYQSLVGPMAPEVADALEIYTMDAAASAGLLDGERDSLSISNMCAFEIGTLYRLDPIIASAVLIYLFRRIERRFSSSTPTLLTVDELTDSLAQPVATAALGAFLLSGRKHNAAVVLAMHELTTLLGSSLGGTINQQCQNRVFLPNPGAATSEARAYAEFGVCRDDAQLIAEATPRQDYFHVSERGRRLISLRMGPAALAFTSQSTVANRSLIEALRRQYPDTWPAHFLRALRVQEWPERCEQLLSATHIPLEENQYARAVAEV